MNLPNKTNGLSIHKRNGGLSDARNAGLDVATGEYIGFVDGDDWVDEDMYETLYHLIYEHQADISICTHYTELPNRTKVKYKSKKNKEFLVLKKQIATLIEDKIIQIISGRNYSNVNCLQNSVFR